jgi:CelD/BcsL family acetyltransferase involved in cellulose biosynthesis
VSAIAARVIRRYDELATLEPAWWALWRRSPAATPFESPAWLMAWWRHFSPGDLFTLAAEEGGKLVALAVCYIENGDLGCRLLPVGIAVSDYHDVLLDPACAADAWSSIRDTALASPESWARWDFEELMPSALALAAPWAGGEAIETALQNACPVLDLSAGELEACLPRSKRRKLALARNRTARRGGAVIEKAAPGDVGVFLDHLYRLHGLRWQSQGEAGVLADEVVRRFHRDAARALASNGLLRLFTLAMAGQVVAVYYGFHHGERAYAYLSGFDPAFEFESPGTLIIAHAMAEATREGAREFHFLRGREAYKYSWGALDRWNQRRTIVRSAGRDAAA